jgi:hypothetical protein
MLFCITFIEIFKSKPLVDETNLTPVSGITYSKGVCSTSKVSLLVDEGYFDSLPSVAQLVAFQMGAVNDGTANTLAASCPANLNYLMAPVWDLSSPTISNINLFSSCSINSIKAYLLNYDKR